MLRIFSFKGRIGRLHLLLAELALLLVNALAIGLLALIARSSPPNLAVGLAILLAFLGLVVAVMWCCLSLHVRRIRDIGWRPLYVVPAWLVFLCVDTAVASRFPWLDATHHHQTEVGVTVNGLLSLILLLWPGRKADVDAPHRDGSPQVAIIGA